MKDICLLDNLIEYLPLNRNLIKLKRRLLSNHGQPFWDACQDRHKYPLKIKKNDRKFHFPFSSWETLFIKSTNQISTVELHCCYWFIDLCRQALFIVYQYSRQQHQIHHSLAITLKT